MAKSYHFLQGTKVVGPLQLDELKSLVQKGVVSGQTMLSDDASNWKLASELVPQLFGKQSASSGVTASSSGAERWYVQANGQQYGPISYTELLGWVSSKSVVAETLVRKSENGAWQRADTVFPHLGSRAVVPRTTKPEPEPAPSSPLAIRTDSPKPVASTSSNSGLNSSSSADSSGGDAMMTIFAVIGGGVVIFAMVQGFVQLKAAFGFAGVIAVVMLIRFLASLGKMSR